MCPWCNRAGHYGDPQRMTSAERAEMLEMGIVDLTCPKCDKQFQTFLSTTFVSTKIFVSMP